MVTLMVKMYINVIADYYYYYCFIINNDVAGVQQCESSSVPATPRFKVTLQTGEKRSH